MSRLSEKYGAAQLAFILAGLVALRAEVENDFDGEANLHADDSSGICWNIQGCYIDTTVQFPDELWAVYGPDRGDIRAGLKQVWSKLSAELFQSWPEFSGNILYPVPGIGIAFRYDEDDDDEYLIADAMLTYDNTCNGWEGEYGASRIRLLSYMIDQLTNDIQGAE